MATLTGNTIASTYLGVLNASGAVGADTVEVITDGAGTSTSLSLSQQRATITLGSGDADDFIVDGTTLVVEGDTNMVGIGTADPEYKLHVEGSASANETVCWFNNDGDNACRIAIRQEARTGYVGVTGTVAETLYSGSLVGAMSFGVSSSVSPLQFWNGGTPSAKMTIETDGKVGIGTTAPVKELDVVGEIRITETSGGDDHLSIRPYTDGIVYFDAHGAGADEGGFRFRNIKTGNEAVAIASDGNVGIGTTTPTTAKVHLMQASASGELPVLKLQQADENETFIDFVGNSESDGSGSISSDTTTDSAKFGAIRIEINGVHKWIRIYDDHS